MQLIIDNTRTSGNFFDNMLNNNMFVTVYDINDSTNINDIVKNDDNVYIQETDYELNSYDYKLKYDYINNDNIQEYINKEYELLYNEQYKNMFTLSLSQYKQYVDFYNNHKKCLIDEKTGRHKFGTIGGGIVKEYYIKNIEDNSFVIDIHVKCLDCNDDEILQNKSVIDVNDNLINSYDLECKYGPKFDKVEFYRFMEIYNEYKGEDLIIGFMSTGLGNLITVKTNEFEYNITNIDNW